jgi:SAM-dependent methyltransferase
VTSQPLRILEELYRVLRPGGRGCVMVYNRQSIWFHLWTAYDRMIVENAFPGLDVFEAFTRNTDGFECPVSRSYSPPEFSDLVRSVGFEVDYLGGYLSRHELNRLEASWVDAIVDERLAEEHRAFLRGLEFDFRGYPIHEGKHAGIGGTYRLSKPAAP